MAHLLLTQCIMKTLQLFAIAFILTLCVACGTEQDLTLEAPQVAEQNMEARKKKFRPDVSGLRTCINNCGSDAGNGTHSDNQEWINDCMISCMDGITL